MMSWEFAIWQDGRLKSLEREKLLVLSHAVLVMNQMGGLALGKRKYKPLKVEDLLKAETQSTDAEIDNWMAAQAAKQNVTTPDTEDGSAKPTENGKVDVKGMSLEDIIAFDRRRKERAQEGV